jgi:hypothetical protein
MSAVIERFHDDWGTTHTTGPLDTNADGDALKYTATNLEGVIQITAMWYDRFGRMTDRVLCGTNGGSDFDRDGLSVPARSDTALRTTSTYATDGTPCASSAGSCRGSLDAKASIRSAWAASECR